MPEETPSPELTAVEAALAGLAPAPSRIDRDQLMFRAGQASAARHAWLWPAATGTLALLSMGLALALLFHPAPQQVGHIVSVPVETQSSPTPLTYRDSAPDDAAGEANGPSALSSYRLEQLALRFGVEALPEAPAAPARTKQAWPEAILDTRDSGKLLHSDFP
jgi:hypothetical protein